MREKYFDKEFCLELSGDFACFTRPELKVERVSYEVITPSAARNIFQAVFWKPAFRWEVTRIEVLNPIRHISIKRNEISATANSTGKALNIEKDDIRTQRNTYMLRDVKYRVFARMVYIPVRNRSLKNQNNYERRPEDEKAAENPGKYHSIFAQKADKGQCFTMPYLGCREFECDFRYIPDAQYGVGIDETRDLGLMLFDMDYESNPQNPPALFFHAVMNHGVIEVPNPSSDEILR